MTEPVEISAVIIVYNGAKFLRECLATLTADLATIPNEIIAIDNGSADGSTDLIAQEFQSVRIVRNGANLGFAKAVNIGIGEAKGKYLYVLNQDLRFRSGATRALLERLSSDRTIGMIGPKYVGFDGRPQLSCRAFPSYKHVIYDALLLSRLFPHSREFGSWRMSWFDHESEMFVDQPMGSVMLIPRGVVERVGELDESFPIFFNDVDYCRRIAFAGYKLLYFPSAVVEHFVGGSTRNRQVAMKLESHRSMYRYLRTYARWYEFPLLWLCGLLLMLGLVPVLLAASVRKSAT